MMFFISFFYHIFSKISLSLYFTFDEYSRKSHLLYLCIKDAQLISASFISAILD